MSSRAPRASASDSLPPSYTITPGPPEYPPNVPNPNPIAAPVPRVQVQVQDAYNFALGPNANANTSANGNGNLKGDGGVEVDVRQLMVARTPSPTPSEKYVLTHKSRSCDLKRMFGNFKNDPRQILTLVLALAVFVLLLLFLVYQRRIEDWLRPAADWMHDTPGGWFIPIAIMFVLSFPPLFGHEIIAVLCGDVWGVWVGFGIVAAGTLLGELGNFFVFKYWCKARAAKMEETSLKYALLAQVVRDGGFKIPVVMRFSAFPGHLLTAIFSTLGMTLWTFLGSALLGLPKQLAVVYIGVSSSSDDPASVKKGRIIKVAVIVATGLVTNVAMWYVYRKMDEVKAGVVYRRRKARQAKMLAAAAGYAGTEDGTLPTSSSKALDADLERAADRDLESISLGTVPSLSAANAHLNVNVDPSANANMNANPFGSSRDTVASTATATARGAVRGVGNARSTRG